MDKHWLDYAGVAVQAIVMIAQAVSLWFLVVNIRRTTDIVMESKQANKISAGVLRQMQDTSEQEIAPYMVAYFDIPYGQPVIYLVIKNLGRSVAEDVKLEFDPPLRNTVKDEIEQLPLLTGGIGSMPPGHEVRAFFDVTTAYYDESKNLPMNYDVTITYSGGLGGDSHSVYQRLDLSMYKGLGYLREKGIEDLVTQVEKIAGANKKMEENLSKLVDTIQEGIWIKNPEHVMRPYHLRRDEWRATVRTILNELQLLWSTVYDTEHANLSVRFITNVRTRCLLIKSQLLVLASSHPIDFEETTQLPDLCVVIATTLLKLERPGVTVFSLTRVPNTTLDPFREELLQHVDEALRLLDSITDSEETLAHISQEAA
jgi:hypothetical protein